MKPLNQLPDKFSELTTQLTDFIEHDLPTHIGVEALRLIARNFQNEAFTDAGVSIAWPARKQPDITSPILTRRAMLRNATRYRISNDTVSVGIDLDHFPHAKILNEGGTIPVTPKMRRFFWYMYYKFYNKRPDSQKNVGPLRKGTKTNLDSGYIKQAQFWFRLTRAKKITIPPRKYIALQKDLLDSIQQICKTRIQEIFQ